ncbi:sigma-70 family RNA polymerase sigma factor [Chitinolyticbacter meiyuanensis]|uniref:sigma-70 family RNA polymerase sigma factor n=1 Tax=Chitinolyticbacter meiyuanensis TaxID=682798 RepID=UPI0011E598AF|nr:sigma-70 family RNA polymerase sigma factor [Chitinolyticbacter meiyuanensis]
MADHDHDPRDDETLMQAWRDGELAAFRLLYGRHRLRLYRFLVRETGSNAAGDELFQEVWLSVVHQRAHYQPWARFSTWLLETAHRRLVDWHRREHRHRWNSDLDATDEVADHCPLPDDAAANRQSGRQLRECLRTLPPEQREAFLLKEEHELGLTEIARLTGAAAETVKSRVRYAIAKLRICMEALA